MKQWAVAAVAASVVALVPSSPISGQGGTPPIVVVVNDTPQAPFGGYLAEILRAEGLNAFDVVPLSSLTAPALGNYRLAVLADTALTAAQATTFDAFVGQGGRLVAMRPDAQLHATFGISAVGGSTPDGYLLVDQSGPGAGLHGMTLPIKGPSAHYALGTAAAAAALYATRTTATAFPAVAIGARTAAWAFDLGRSVAYIRQGDPAYVDQDRDPQPVYRTNDIFFQTTDLERTGVPHADVQMRLFVRVIESLLADSLPLPRLWYFPGTSRTLLVPTGDSHTTNLASYTSLLAAAENAGARMTLYLPRWSTLPAGTVDGWRTAGHEISLHPYFEPDGFQNDMAGGYTVAVNWWQSVFGFPYGATTRHHSLEWTGWVTPAAVMAARGVRMDLSYYAWGPALDHPNQQVQAHGYLNGSGQPMRFVTQSGQVLPVYQQVTALTDEQLLVGSYAQGLTVPQALAVSRQLIDDSQAGGYSAIATQFHVDTYPYAEVGPWVDGTLAYAQSLQIPMWTAQRWLQFAEARAATAVQNVSWSANDRTLSFTATLPAGAEPLTVLVPAAFGGDALTTVVIDGQAATAGSLNVSGRTMRTIQLSRPAGGAARSVAVLYAVPTPAIRIGDATVVEGHSGTTAVQLAVTLSAPTGSPVTVQFQTASGTATEPADYQAATGTVSFAAFQTSQVVTVAVVGDTMAEGTETFSVTLANATNAVVEDGVGVVTITDDDVVAPLPALSIADVSVAEGNSGTAAASFTVSLSSPSAAAITVQYATASGTATAGADFTAASGTLTFPAGTTSRPLVVQVLGDTAVEPAETFLVTLSAPVNALIADGEATGTIVNDDTGSGPTTVVLQVRSGADDVTEEAGGFTADAGTVWMGTGPAAATSFTGLRFTAVTIPPGAVVSSARLELHAASAQWLTVGWQYGVEAAANSAPFSFGDRPSQRPLLPPTVAHASDQQWLAATWYQLDEIGPLVQAAINQPGWASGNALAVVLRGAGNNWARKFATAYEGSATQAPRLVVTYAAAGAPLPTVAIADATTVEGNSGSTAMAFAVTLSAASAQPVSVSWTTANGSATAGSDYTAASGTVTFPANSTAPQTVTVQVSGDTAIEPDEAFVVNLGGPVNATIADGQATGAITNDDAPSSVLSISSPSVAEGQAGSAPLTFTVTLSPASGQTVTATYATAAGTATPGADFVSASGTVTFAPGETAKTVTVQVTGDLLDEADETLTMALTAPVNATLGAATGTGTISDDDPAPALSVGDVSVSEGQSGTIAATFGVTLAAASGRVVTVAYATADGSAAAPADYIAQGGTITFAAGETTRSVSVLVSGDTVVEPNETFSVILSSPVNVSIADGTGLGTILNDDSPSLSIAATASVTEGQSGSTPATFAVTLSAPATGTVTVNYTTAAGTATTASDFTPASGTLTFLAGEVSKAVVVTVLGDTAFEANETFTVTLSGASGATIAVATGTATIVNDDGGPVANVDSVAVTEGSGGAVTAVFTVSLSAASGLTTTVGYSTAGGSATSGSDFTAVSGTLTFSPGATQQQVVVSVLGDALHELAETFTLTLATPANATLGIAVGTGTIVDNDAPPAVSIGNATVTEGNSGTGNAVFTVSLSGASGLAVSVTAATGNGTATAGSDYTALVGQTVTIAAGATSATVAVPVTGDVLVEASETFTVTLSAPVNATLGTTVGTGTITNDDTPALAISDVTVAEGNTGATAASFTVSLSQPHVVPVTVTYATANGTATAGSDYTAIGATVLTIPAGTTSLPVAVSVFGDTASEPNETFVVNLSAAGNATIADAQGVGTISNDDAGAVTVTVTYQVAAGADDVNELTNVLTAGDATAWLGNASSTTASYTGFRFANVTIPAGATITSARLEVNAASTQWQRMAFEFAMEAAANSAAFTTTSRPSQRTLLTPRVTHSTDAQWTASTWYQLEQIAPLLQAAVGQAGWQSGNAVSVVLRGTGAAWARKFIRAFEGGAASAPRLVVTYQLAP